jgi:hypothetical protein
MSRQERRAKEREERKAKQQKRLAKLLASFPTLPDDAIAVDPLAAAVLGMSVWTLQRNNPVPAREISERIRGRRVGDIRALVRGEVTA